VWTELCAYGTAVVAIPISDGAKQTAAALGYGNPGGSPATADTAQAYQQPAAQPQYQQPQYQQPAQPQYQQPQYQQPEYQQPQQGYPQQ
jgi:DNA segregation ATPase FtsK/SpoIIIE-like protein